MWSRLSTTTYIGMCALSQIDLAYSEAGHPDAYDLTRAFSRGNSDAMDILTLGLGLGLGRVLGLELGHQDVPGLKNTEVNFLASGQSRQDVVDPAYSASVILRTDSLLYW